MTTEAGHGRDETRTDRQLPAPESPPGFTLGNGLKSIGVVMSECVRDGNATLEVRYSLSGLDLGVKRCARAIRRHWGIENACHGSLDVTEREEEARIRDEVPREDFAWLTRFTVSLLKQHPSRESLAMKRRSRGWSDDFLMQVLTGKAIEWALALNPTAVLQHPPVGCEPDRPPGPRQPRRPAVGQGGQRGLLDRVGQLPA